MFIFLQLLIQFVIGTKYILTPKNHVYNLMDLNLFSTEHKMSTLASFDDVTFYTISKDDYYMYSNTLDDLFHVEQEQTFSINNRINFDENNNKNFIILDENGNIKYGEYNNINFGTDSDLPWHLDRITKHTLPLNGTYPYDHKGSCHKNVNVDIHTYVIDTGIDVNHDEFEGRATWLANFADQENKDCNSHGTHCAGLVGSKTYGVCKDAKLFAVKVLDCQGSGSTSSVIQGIEFAYKRHLEESKKSEKKVKSIVSMSLGGGKSFALNKAVKATLKNDDFYFAAAAGNENNDACNTSPAGVKEIFTVMASDRNDNRAYFSNYGNCADIYSPGVNILSTIPDGKRAVYSGTSMATPIFVGVLNHYIDLHDDLNMKSLKQLVLEKSSKDQLSSNPKNTNNMLAYLNR